MAEDIGGFTEVTGQRKQRLYVVIYKLPENISSECPNFVTEFYRTDDGRTVRVAKCKYLGDDGYLISPVAEKCMRYWRDCPYYKMSLHEEER